YVPCVWLIGVDSSVAICLGQFAKVVAHRCQPHRISKRSSVMSKRMCHEPPELEPLPIAHAELEGYASKRRHISYQAIAPLRFRPGLRYSLQAFERPIIVFASIVDGTKDRLVPLNQPPVIHYRDEVQIRMRVVAGALTQQPPL